MNLIEIFRMRENKFLLVEYKQTKPRIIWFKKGGRLFSRGLEEECLH